MGCHLSWPTQAHRWKRLSMATVPVVGVVVREWVLVTMQKANQSRKVLLPSCSATFYSQFQMHSMK